MDEYVFFRFYFIYFHKSELRTSELSVRQKTNAGKGVTVLRLPEFMMYHMPSSSFTLLLSSDHQKHYSN